MLEAHVEILDGPDAGQLIPLKKEQLTIGRLARNEIAVNGDTAVSRQHARLVFRNGAWAIADLNSTSGTFVNGDQQSRASLNDGDEIRVGKTRMAFRLGSPSWDAPATPSAPPPPAAGPAAPADQEFQLEDDGGFEIEFPADNPAPAGPAAAPPPPAPVAQSPAPDAAPIDPDGLTDDGEDPFAEDDIPEISMRGSSPAAGGASARGGAKPGHKTGAFQVEMRGGKAELYTKVERGRYNALTADLDQSGSVVRWVAIVAAIAVAAGLFYVSMTAFSGGGGAQPIDPDLIDEEQPSGPLRPGRPN